MPISDVVQRARDVWLQTGEGKRFTELRNEGAMRTPKGNEEYNRLYDKYLKVGMTSAEKLEWARELAEAESIDRAEEKEREQEMSANPNTIPDVLNLEPEIFTVVGEEHTHEAWGIRWRVPPGKWQILGMGFRRKNDAAEWMRERVSGPGLEAEVIQVVISSDWDGEQTTTVYREA